MTNTDMLAEGLVLAVTAPSDEQAETVVKLCEQLTRVMTPLQVARAKKTAKARLDEMGY